MLSVAAVSIHDRHCISGRDITTLYTQSLVAKRTLINTSAITRIVFLYVGLDILVAGTVNPRLRFGCIFSLANILFVLILTKHRHFVKRNGFLIARCIHVGRLVLSVVFVACCHDQSPWVSGWLIEQSVSINFQ
ncbi:MAG: hypothetical protein PHP70_10610 [Gallionella sp.]|nr:hypothetical protein [Gallionella sp.]